MCGENLREGIFDQVPFSRTVKRERENSYNYIGNSVLLIFEILRILCTYFESRFTELALPFIGLWRRIHYYPELQLEQHHFTCVQFLFLNLKQLLLNPLLVLNTTQFQLFVVQFL